MKCVRIDRYLTRQSVEAQKLISDWAQNCGSPAWTILQSFESFQLIEWRANLPAFAKIFSGRIFGADAEVRWVRESDTWTIWLVQEASDGVVCQADRRRYYLWGIYSSPERRFSEDRIPGVPQYPIGQTPKDQDRAFVEVVEYAPAGSGNATLDSLNRELNQPRLIAHRFASLGCGRSPDIKEEE